MTAPASYADGFAPRDASPLYPQLWKGCVGAWAPSLGPTGLVLRDWSGQKNHGNLTNMITDTDWVVNKGVRSLQYAATKYVAVPYFPGLASASVMSYSLWCSANSRGGSSFGQAFIQGASDGPSSVRMLYNGTNTCGFRVSNSSELTFSLPHDGVWRHVACVYRISTEQSVYVNGVRVATQVPGAYSASFRTTIEIGGSSLWWDGNIAGMAAYNRILSHDEIRLLAQSPNVMYAMDRQPRSSTQAAAAGGITGPLIGGRLTRAASLTGGRLVQ